MYSQEQVWTDSLEVALQKVKERIKELEKQHKNDLFLVEAEAEAKFLKSKEFLDNLVNAQKLVFSFDFSTTIESFLLSTRIWISTDKRNVRLLTGTLRP